MKIIFTKGLPGSGKSTWAKEFVEKNKDHVRINRDDLRNMRGLYWLPKQEDFITSLEIHSIQSALNHNLNVVVDSTNLNDSHVAKLTKAAKDIVPDIEVEIKEFNVSPEECIKRDLKRPNSVGAEVIWGMYDKYINPPKLYVEDKSLPHCVICDIDGTLADMGARGPFEWSRVINDLPIPQTVGLVRKLYETTTIILFSGRDSVCAEDTASWLQLHDIPFHKLYMRPQGNQEKDSIIKSRLFEEYIRGKYYCDFIIDDRKQVKRMWVQKGLFVLDVNQKDKEF